MMMEDEVNVWGGLNGERLEGVLGVVGDGGLEVW